MPERSDTVTSVSVSEKRRGDTERAHQRAEGGQRGDTDPRRMTDRSNPHMYIRRYVNIGHLKPNSIYILLANGCHFLCVYYI